MKYLILLLPFSIFANDNFKCDKVEEINKDSIFFNYIQRCETKDAICYFTPKGISCIKKEEKLDE